MTLVGPIRRDEQGGMTVFATLDTAERLICRAPVVVERRVLWGECDPAQIVYTPRFADYLAAAGGWFNREVMSRVSPSLADLGLLAPAKGLTLEFIRPLASEDLFHMTVLVERIGSRSFTLRVAGTSPEGEARFVGRLSPIVVDKARYVGVPIPAAHRAALAVYQAGQSGEIAPIQEQGKIG